jgi:hypothetical protein
MAEPENQTLRILREFRQEMKEFRTETAKNFDRTEAKLKRLEERISSVAQTVIGEDVLGRYAAAEVEDRLAIIEKRLSVLERRRRPPA